MSEQSPVESEDDGVRKRMNKTATETTKAQSGANTSTAVSASSSDDDDLITVVKEKRLHKLKKILPQSSDKLGSYIDALLLHLPER